MFVYNVRLFSSFLSQQLRQRPRYDRRVRYTNVRIGRGRYMAADRIPKTKAHKFCS